MASAASPTVGRLFHDVARRYPKRIAVEFEGESLSYAELSHRVDRLGTFLLSGGLRSGDRVAVLSRNSPDYITLQLAAAKFGIAVACLNWRQAEDELIHCIELAQPKMLLTGPEFKDAARRLADRINLRTVPFVDAFGYSLDCQPKLPEIVDGEEIFVILYTSGTTGWPKAAAISHRAMVARAAVSALDNGVIPHLPSVVWAPMFHMAGTDSSIIALLHGGTVLLFDKYDPAQLALLVTQRAVGVLPLMPATIGPLIDCLQAYAADVKPPRLIGSMADLLPPHQIAQITTLLKAPFRNTFGSTETGLAPASKGLIAMGVAPQDLAKTQSSLCAVALVDETGNEVPDGTPGEVAVCSPTLFSGYINGSKLDNSMLVGGWFRMGDIMIRREDGLLDFVDRKKYLIKSGGENIYPAELERVLLASPRISEATIVRAKSEKWGETPVAFVVRNDPTLSESEVMKMFEGQIAGYKRPTRIVFIDEKALPRSTLGKIQRHVLEAQLSASPEQSKTDTKPT